MLVKFRPRRPSRVTVGRTPLFKGTGAVGLLFVAFLSVVPAAQARTSCSYTGPPANDLTVTATAASLGEISRVGQQIVVGEFLERPRPCSGGVPTVLNTDTITVLMRGDAFVDLRLDRGAFAPGATAESEGASEIEVVFSGRDAFGEVVGTRHADEFHWAPGGAHPGLNLNPLIAGDEDVDVTVTGGEFGFLVAEGAAGNDTIVPASGAVVRDGVFSDGGGGNDVLTAPPNQYGNLDGGSGNDVLTGGRSFDNLDGGGGKDRVVAGAGHDEIDGGRGRDVLSGGRGRDRIDARDSERDTVRCGSGRDRVRADRRDRLRGCERISRLPGA